MKRIYLAMVAAVLAVVGLVLILAPVRYQPGLTGAVGSFGGFYLGFAGWLFIATRRKTLTDAAVWSVVAGMIGILAGRGADMISCGLPDAGTVVSAAVELLVAVCGAWIIRRTARAG